MRVKSTIRIIGKTVVRGRLIGYVFETLNGEATIKIGLDTALDLAKSNYIINATAIQKDDGNFELKGIDLDLKQLPVIRDEVKTNESQG